MSTETLLPCPFCGGEADWAHSNKMTVRVFCKKCPSQVCQKRTTRVTFEFLKDATFDLWNRRAPQTVSVIAPPLEWGEWKSRPDLGDDDSSKETLCFRYTIWRRGNLHNSAFGGKCLTWDGSKGLPDPVCTEAEAKAACQSHRQAQVNAALKGCNVIPYRDPQGLVDALKSIEQHATNTRESRCDDDGLDILPDDDLDSDLAGMAETARVALQRWEEEK